jgi:flagellar FliJ protein
MNASQRLKPIKRIADNKEKTSARALGDSVNDKHCQEEKLQQLIKYRAEYIASMIIKTEQGMSGDQLQQYHLFLNKLDDAINQQRSAVDISEQNLTLNKNKWRSNNNRANAIKRVIGNLENKELLKSNKKESAQLDELSTQAFLRSKRF